MAQTIILSFLAGLMGGNAIPHFVKGITKENYPNVFGYSPLPNLITGWIAMIITVLLIHWAQIEQYSFESFIAIALGVLLIGLFHAQVGAFGKQPSKGA